jgi:hypothetical protein
VINNYKTGGQKMTKQEVKKMIKKLRVSDQGRFWVNEFDEEDWHALFMTELEELFEYDKDYLRVF